MNLLQNVRRVVAALAEIRAAIIEKGQTPAGKCETFPAAIRAIETGIDVSDTTAIPTHVLYPDYYYGPDGVKTQGRMTHNEPIGTKFCTPATWLTYPPGYYDLFSLVGSTEGTTAKRSDVRKGKFYWDEDCNLVEGNMAEIEQEDVELEPNSSVEFAAGLYKNAFSVFTEGGASDATSGSLDVEYRSIYTIDTGLGSELQHFNLYFKSTAKPSSGNILSSADWNADDPTRYLEGYVYGTSTNHEGGWNLLTLFAPASSYPQSHQAIIDVTDGVVTIKTAGTANPGNGHITWMATKAV